MPQLTSRNAIGAREDISDVIHKADSKKTSFFTMVKKGTKPMSTQPQWPVESYPDPTSEGAVDEKDVQDFENLGAPDALLSGRIQIWERKPRVSRLAQLVTNQAGIGPRKAYAKAVAKALVMIVRDIELTALSDNESRAGTSSLGGKIRGLGKWISDTAQTDLPVDAAYRPDAAAIYKGAIASLADDDLVGIMQAIFDKTGDDEMQLIGLCGSTAKRRLSKLTAYMKDEASYTAVRRYGDADSKVISQKVDLLETDFGQVILRNSSFINTGGDAKSAASKRLAHFLNMDTISMRFAEAPNARELENAGGGPRGIVEAIGTLEVGNPLFLGGLQPAS